MTGTQIKTLAETYLDGDVIADADSIAWINECQISDLGMDARYLKSVDITVTDTSAWNSLPADFIAVYQIDYSDGTEYYKDYKVRGGKVLFPIVTTFKVWYYALTAEIAALTETPQAHTLLHRRIAMFLASRYKLKDGEFNASARLMLEYQEGADHVLYEIDNPIQDASLVIKVV